MELAHEVVNKLPSSGVMWSDAFPWMERWSIFTGVRVKVDDLSFKQVPTTAGDVFVEASQIADVIMSQRARAPLSTTLPYVPLDFEISQHYERMSREIPSRARVRVFGDIAESTPDDLLSNFKIGGAETVEVMPSLVLENVLAYIALSATDVTVPSEPVIGLDDLTVLLDFLNTIPDLPVAVADALQRVRSTPYGDQISDCAEILSDFANSLNEKERAVLLRRTVSTQRETLQEIADTFGVARERIRQVEVKVDSLARVLLENNVVVAKARAELFAAVGELTTCRSLEAQLPHLSRVVEPFKLEAWRVIDFLDKEIEADETWVAVPSLELAAASFNARVSEVAEYPGAVTVEKIREMTSVYPNLSGDDIVAYAKSLGYVAMLDVLIEPSRRSINDRAEIILLRTMGPLTSEAIHEKLPVDRSIRVVRIALQGDPRFVTTAPNTYALAEWGAEEFQGIRSELIKRVQAAGSIAISAAIAEFTEKYGVASNSVYAYASTWPLELVGGNIVLAMSRPVHSSKLRQTRRLYKREHGVALRLTLNGEHVRGSGTPISKQFGVALNMKEGDSLTFTTATGSMAVRWKQQVQLGSLKPLINLHNFTVGDEVYVEAVAGAITLVRVPKVTQTGVVALAQQLNVDSTGAESFVLDRIRATLDLEPNAGVADIESCLLNRGEADFAAVLNPSLTQDNEATDETNGDASEGSSPNYFPRGDEQMMLLTGDDGTVVGLAYIGDHGMYERRAGVWLAVGPGHDAFDLTTPYDVKRETVLDLIAKFDLGPFNVNEVGNLVIPYS